MKKTQESKLKRACLDLLHLRGYFAISIPTVGIPIGRTGKMRTLPRRGIADIYWTGAKVDGRGGWIECKVAPRKQTPEQIEFQKLVEKAGNTYWVIYDIDELVECLDKVEHSREWIRRVEVE